MAIPLEKLLELGPDGMLDHDEEPGIEDLRNARQTYFEDVSVGDDLPRYVHRYSAPELARWCITMENTHRLHYDIAHTHNHDNLPGALFHGTWRMSIVSKWLKNWSLPNGWFWKASWQVREMVTAGETTVLWGKVIDCQKLDDYGLVHIELGIVNEEGWEGAPGTAMVALPYRDGEPVPYPFVPPEM